MAEFNAAWSSYYIPYFLKYNIHIQYLFVLYTLKCLDIIIVKVEMYLTLFLFIFWFTSKKNPLLLSSTYLTWSRHGFTWTSLTINDSVFSKLNRGLPIIIFSSFHIFCLVDPTNIRVGRGNLLLRHSCIPFPIYATIFATWHTNWRNLTLWFVLLRYQELKIVLSPSGNRTHNRSVSTRHDGLNLYILNTVICFCIT